MPAERVVDMSGSRMRAKALRDTVSRVQPVRGCLPAGPGACQASDLQPPAASRPDLAGLQR